MTDNSNYHGIYQTRVRVFHQDIQHQEDSCKNDVVFVFSGLFSFFSFLFFSFPFFSFSFHFISFHFILFHFIFSFSSLLFSFLFFSFLFFSSLFFSFLSFLSFLFFSFLSFFLSFFFSFFLSFFLFSLAGGTKFEPDDVGCPVETLTQMFNVFSQTRENRGIQKIC